MLVTVTPRLRIHREEVIYALLKGNTVHLRFASMRPMRIPVDDLTDEARFWLLPSLAPRDIPAAGDVERPAGEAEQPVDETY